MVHEKTFTNKAQHFFWFQVGDIKISDIFYKIQKFRRTSLAPIITSNGINFLMAGPFHKFSGFLKTYFIVVFGNFANFFILLHHLDFFWQILALCDMSLLP